MNEIKDSANIDGSELLEHPAVKAWLALHAEQGWPAEITTLKPSRRKSAVYRLADLSASGLTVVAKCCPLEVARVEDTVYRQLLPHVPYPTLRFFGTVEISEDDIGWLFIEYSDGIRFSSANPDHRKLAAHWMSLLHMATERFSDEIPLPSRQLPYYHDLVLAASETLRAGLANRHLAASQVELLQDTIDICDLLDSRWLDIEKILISTPTTLAHGGFHGKNVRVGDREGMPALAVFDWESAGWGLPIIDLAYVDIAEYRRCLGDAWPQLTIGRLDTLVCMGKLFGTLKVIPGEKKTLSGPWAGKAVGKLRYYYAEIAAATAALLGKE